MELIFQTLVSGVVLGSSYGLVAVGLTFVFGIGKVVNFAHGEFAMIGAYVMVLCIQHSVPWIVAVLIGVVGVGFLGWLIETVIVSKGLYRGNEQASVIATFALSLILSNAALMIFGATPKQASSPFSNHRVSILGATVDAQRLLTAGVSLCILVGLTLWLRHGRLGLQMQAVSQNQRGALYTGVNVRRVQRIAFVLGVGLAGLAGVLVAPTMTAYPSMGTTLVVTAFTVVILGGLGSVKGAAVAGLIIGILYAGIATYVSVQWTTAVGWIVVVLLLLVRPQGLFGERPVRA